EISDKEEELDKLRNMLLLVDAILKGGSFKPASTISQADRSVKFGVESSVELESKHVDENRESVNIEKPASVAGSSNRNDSYYVEEIESKELRSVRDNLLLANAEITLVNIKITPVEDLSLSTNIPPFRTFFLNRILDGMKLKDNEKIHRGEIQESYCIDYRIDTDDDGIIRAITISNYRERERLQEILSTVTWVFSKMVEKGSQQTHG
ncbi:MAG: hypothetical protein M3O24_00755, partial [Thermoproteota archaeon]|nr:hypothetical protein [Thermoproteota archaeon]